ncbi:hypothetical protein CBL_03502 [Carabus blaptoides fortunei]
MFAGGSDRGQKRDVDGDDVSVCKEVRKEHESQTESAINNVPVGRHFCVGAGCVLSRSIGVPAPRIKTKERCTMIYYAGNDSFATTASGVTAADAGICCVRSLKDGFKISTQISQIKSVNTCANETQRMLQSNERGLSDMQTPPDV